MNSCRTSAVVRWACGVAVLPIFASGLVSGCGPSQDDVRASINDTCVELVQRLSELDANPAFSTLAEPADQARAEFGAAAYRVEDISTTNPVQELASALHAVRKAYADLETGLTTRDYASLAQTRRDGERALADAISAAGSIGASDCQGMGARVEYFTIAADGAAAAAARIAPTGDYVADVDAACARYADDTFAVHLKLDLQSLIAADGGTPDAGEYIEAIEDLLTLESALDVLVGELSVLAPPAEAEAAHALLIDGFQGAVDGFRSLRIDGGVEEVVASAEQVMEAARLLEVDCSV